MEEKNNSGIKCIINLSLLMWKDFWENFLFNNDFVGRLPLLGKYCINFTAAPVFYS